MLCLIASLFIVLTTVYCVKCADVNGLLAAGDGSFACPPTLEDLEELEACENDNDYTFLLRHLCNDGYMPSGPYLREAPDDCDWQRLKTQKVTKAHDPPVDDGIYD